MSQSRSDILPRKAQNGAVTGNSTVYDMVTCSAATFLLPRKDCMCNTIVQNGKATGVACISTPSTRRDIDLSQLYFKTCYDKALVGVNAPLHSPAKGPRPASSTPITIAKPSPRFRCNRHCKCNCKCQREILSVMYFLEGLAARRDDSTLIPGTS